MLPDLGYHKHCTMNIPYKYFHPHVYTIILAFHLGVKFLCNRGWMLSSQVDNARQFWNLIVVIFNYISNVQEFSLLLIFTNMEIDVSLHIFSPYLQSVIEDNCTQKKISQLDAISQTKQASETTHQHF